MPHGNPDMETDNQGRAVTMASQVAPSELVLDHLRERVAVCGGRTFTGRELVYEVLAAVAPKRIIHGGAKGADAIADTFARDHGIPVAVWRANWYEHGKDCPAWCLMQAHCKLAGIRRNRLIIAEGQPTMLVAFPGNKGTANMIKQCQMAGIHIWGIPGMVDGKLRRMDDFVNRHQ